MSAAPAGIEIGRFSYGGKQQVRRPWKIKGPDGAAELLSVKPTTLLSRIDKWGLKKPAAS